MKWEFALDWNSGLLKHDKIIRLVETKEIVVKVNELSNEVIKNIVNKHNEEVGLVNDLNNGMVNVMKSLISMFETVNEEDGEHTLKVSHEALMKLKNEIEEVIK